MKVFSEEELSWLEEKGECLAFLATALSGLHFPKTRVEVGYIASRFKRLIAHARAHAKVTAFLGTHQDSLVGIVIAAEESAHNGGKPVLAEERRVVKEALINLLKEINQG